jgi:hypothetical protein
MSCSGSYWMRIVTKTPWLETWNPMTAVSSLSMYYYWQNISVDRSVWPRYVSNRLVSHRVIMIAGWLSYFYLDSQHHRRDSAQSVSWKSSFINIGSHAFYANYTSLMRARNRIVLLAISIVFAILVPGSIIGKIERFYKNINTWWTVNERAIAVARSKARCPKLSAIII